jgi:hypothetical protein
MKSGSYECKAGSSVLTSVNRTCEIEDDAHLGDTVKLSISDSTADRPAGIFIFLVLFFKILSNAKFSVRWEKHFSSKRVSFFRISKILADT